MSGDKTPLSQITIGDLKVLITEGSKEAIKDGIKDIDKAVKEVLNKVDELVAENIKLRQEINELKKERTKDKRELSTLQDQIRNKNIVIKGMPSSLNLKDAINKVCLENLKLDSVPKIRSVKKIYDKNGKMGVVAELDTESDVYFMLNNTRNLARTVISMEKDLSSSRREDKRVMMQLKRDIGTKDTSQRLQVRDDRLRVGDKWFKWNLEKELICGKQKGEHALRGIYGNNLEGLDLSYHNIYNKIKNNVRIN